MGSKDIDRQPQIPGDQPNGDSLTEAWTNRGRLFIEAQRAGIDTWPADGRPVVVTTLVDAYITITPVLNEHDGSDAGRLVEFHMKERDETAYRHMASMLYGPPRTRLGFQLKRQLLKTMHHA